MGKENNYLTISTTTTTSPHTQQMIPYLTIKTFETKNHSDKNSEISLCDLEMKTL